MKITKILSVPVLMVLALGLASCADTDAQYTIPAVDAPAVVSTTPTEGTVLGSAGDVTITVQYDKRVFFASQNYTSLQFTGGTVTSAKVYDKDSVLTIVANVPNLGTNCSLTIPAGLVTGPNKMPAPEFTLNFSTKALPTVATSPVAGTSVEAVALYNFLLSNYKSNIISGMMANVNWNNNGAEQVYAWTGKYPAINGYDYIHLAASWGGANWIDYSDITPVKTYTDNGGIACIGWHWLVPKEQVYITAPEGKSVWSGSVDMGTSWGASEQISADALAGVAEGTILTLDFTQNSDASYWQIKAMDGSWTTLSSYKDLDNGWGCIDTKKGDTSVSITLNATDAEAIKANGLILSGYGLTYTGVSIADAPTGKAYSSLDVNSDLTYGTGTFTLANAVTEGTWEYDVVQQDLKRVATYLKLLKDAGIPVLWRPLHEASGGWFWWGTDAASFKKLWQMMFDYFKAEGLDNLIWVWTSQGDDDDWYPGDAYVDVIGCDLYGSTVAACAEEYQNLIQKYGKIVTLSECGYSTSSSSRIATAADQWAAGAKWSWFMPWYDGSDTTEDARHSTQAWWQAAMSMSNIITRDKVNLK